jgi:hypothetical protein
MTQENILGKWIREKFGSQTQFGLKLGVNPTMVSRWMNGGGISDDYKAKIRKLGYTGPWPREEAQEAPAGVVTREEYEAIRQELWKVVGRLETLERAFERQGEVVRDLVRESEGSRPRGPKS